MATKLVYSLQDGRNGSSTSEQFLWVGSTDFSKWISDDSSTLFSLLIQMLNVLKATLGR